jgi:NitT/TauT family transport system substrate-binding protein
MRAPRRLPGRLALLALSVAAALAACSPAPSAPPRAAPAPPPPVAPPPGAPAPASAATAAPAPLSPPVPVKVGFIGTVAERGLFVALERGYFAAEGLDLELVPSRTLTDSLPALLTGELQYGNGGAEPALFNAALRGVNVKIVNYNIIVGRGEQSSAFIVRQDVFDSGRYREPRDLSELLLAMPPGSGTPQIFLERLLARAGLTLADAETVPLPFPDMVPAIGNRAVEGAFLAEPFISVLERQGTARVVIPTGELEPEMAANVLAISPAFAEQQAEAARRFMAAHLRGQRDYYRAIQRNEGGRDEIIQILIKHTPIKDPSLYSRLLTSPVDPNSELNPRLLDPAHDFYLRQGVVSQSVEVSRLIDRSYADYALERLGRQE